MSLTITSAPALASRTAWARPWPRPPPVMNATLPDRSLMEHSSLEGVRPASPAKYRVILNGSRGQGFHRSICPHFCRCRCRGRTAEEHRTEQIAAAQQVLRRPVETDLALLHEVGVMDEGE